MKTAAVAALAIFGVASTKPAEEYDPSKESGAWAVSGMYYDPGGKPADDGDDSPEVPYEEPFVPAPIDDYEDELPIDNYHEDEHYDDDHYDDHYHDHVPDVHPVPEVPHPVDAPVDVPVPDYVKHIDPPSYTMVPDAGYQQKCGSLYTDVTTNWLEHLLVDIDPEIITYIIDIMNQILDAVSNLDTSADGLTGIVSLITEVTDYCNEHLTDDDMKTKVVEVMNACQTTYGSVYEAPVDEPVYQAMDGLWKSCKDTGEPEYVEKMYHCMNGYMTKGYDAPEFTDYVAELEASDYAPVAQAAQDLEYTVSLQSVDDDDSDTESTASDADDDDSANIQTDDSGAAQIATGFGAVAVAVIAAAL